MRMDLERGSCSLDSAPEQNQNDWSTSLFVEGRRKDDSDLKSLELL